MTKRGTEAIHYRSRRIRRKIAGAGQRKRTINVPRIKKGRKGIVVGSLGLFVDTVEQKKGRRGPSRAKGNLLDFEDIKSGYLFSFKNFIRKEKEKSKKF